MATIIFSHGFGVRSDARGMFTDIADAFPHHRFVHFDYNRILDNGDIEVAPLHAQAEKLQQVLDAQDEKVIIIAHSQGCVITGLVDLSNAHMAVLLAPPEFMSMQRVIEKLSKRPGSTLSLDGISRLTRSDGTTTHIPKEYIHSVSQVDPLDAYKKVSRTIPTVVVRCLHDNVLGETNMRTIHDAKHYELEADHDFTGDARDRLVQLLRAVLV